MSSPKVTRGSIVMISPDGVVGAEQMNDRPAVVIHDESVQTTYPVFCVVPLTRTPRRGTVYPQIHPSSSNGLKSKSYVLADQVRVIDPARLTQLLGVVDPPDLNNVERALRTWLKLP